MRPAPHIALEARHLHVQGLVQGVGFRPMVYRLAHRHGLEGWVYNTADGVHVHVQGPRPEVEAFVEALPDEAPATAAITALRTVPTAPQTCHGFVIRESPASALTRTHIAADLRLCPACTAELLDPSDRRAGYPYLNCTQCGPRYSIIEALPYDRPHTTMHAWPLCADCAREYHDPLDRRFHAQPTACPACGPHYTLHEGQHSWTRQAALEQTVALLKAGKIVAIKGLGGYHLACDAHHEGAVHALRTRKYRKEKPFALMVASLDTARGFAAVSPQEEALLLSPAAPIVLLQRDPSTCHLPPTIAPHTNEVGVMVAYAPLHVLLFALGAPPALVMTSANRSNEPIAYRDAEARSRLHTLADAFLVGERPIARRVDDSVARVAPTGTMLLRRARGYAPAVVTRLPVHHSLLALGADLKNTVTLVVDGEAIVSQHLGDLEQVAVQQAFEETVRDLTSMYRIDLDTLPLVHDRHPAYFTTQFARSRPNRTRAVQHHRAHIASVLAERSAWDTRVVGIAYDGTGYGDDGTIWGGEIFAGSLRHGLRRVAHLRPAWLPGGDAAARVPVQAAAGFLAALPGVPDMLAAPFHFPHAYTSATELIRHHVRTFRTTSMGRLFDTAAALLGFTRPITYEGQAACWLEHLALTAPPTAPYPFPNLDYEPLLAALLADVQRGRARPEIARAFHEGVAYATACAALRWAQHFGTNRIVVSGGVFQNRCLLRALLAYLQQEAPHLTVWTNRDVPPNDGGISLGQAALASMQHATQIT